MLLKFLFAVVKVTTTAECDMFQLKQVDVNICCCEGHDHSKV